MNDTTFRGKSLQTWRGKQAFSSALRLTRLESDTRQTGPQWARLLASQKTAWKFFTHSLAWLGTWLFCPSSDSSRASAGSLRRDGVTRQLLGFPDSCGYLKMKAEKSVTYGTESTCSNPSGPAVLRTDGFPPSSYHTGCWHLVRASRPTAVFREVLPTATSPQGGIHDGEAAREEESFKAACLCYWKPLACCLST